MTAPIVGATQLEHLNAALEAVELTLSDQEIQELESPYQPHAMRGFEYQRFSIFPYRSPLAPAT